MLRIIFAKELGNEPYTLSYNDEVMDEGCVNDLVGLIECLYPQSAVLTIHKNEVMVAVWSRKGRRWTLKVPDGAVSAGMNQVARLIRGESALTA